MTLLFQSGTCGIGDGRGNITLWQQGRILLQQRGIILLQQRGRVLLWRWSRVLLWQWSRVLLWQWSRVLLRWQGIYLWQWQGVFFRGSSMCIVVDGTSKHVLCPPEGVLEYGCCVLHFDYGNSGQRCAEDERNGKDGWDVGL
jgi:hypothetical protein